MSQPQYQPQYQPQSQPHSQPELKKSPKFATMVLVFITGALSFAVALSYNNFAQAIIKRYSYGDGIMATAVNLVVFTAVAIAVLWAIWKSNPQAVTAAVQ